MKKILATALLCAVSAFATWDYFPVKEAGKGEVKVGAEYQMQQEDAAGFGIRAKARFSVIEGLEVALFGAFPMTVTLENGDSCEGDDCPPSYMRPAVGVRYWLPAGLGIALDVTLPFRGDGAAITGEGENLVFTPAVQFSKKLTEELDFGSQVSFSIPLEDDNKYTPTKELGIGLELDYSLGVVTPFVGVDVAVQVAKEQYDGKDDLSPDTATGFSPFVGVIFSINEMLSADVGAAFGIGEDYYGKDTQITLNANLSVNF